MKIQKLFFIIILLSSAQYLFAQTNSSSINTITDFPIVPKTLMESEISLLGSNKKITLENYANKFKGKVLVVFFLTSWCGPCIVQAKNLQAIYQATSSDKVQILGVGVETPLNEKKNFPSFVKKSKIKYNFGLIDEKVFNNFVDFSKFDGIPQSFVIYNGKLYGNFAGGGEKLLKKLQETVAKTLEINK